MSANAFTILGVETTKGTLSSALKSVPLDAPQITPQQKRLRDAALRGSPIDLYGMVAGVRNDMYDCKGNVFADTFPILLRSFLGSPDMVTAAPTNTTLAAGATAGAATISTVATIPAGSAITFGTAPTAESHVVSAVSGSGPFTVTLTQPVHYNQLSGIPVAGLTAHKIGIQNDQVGSQPPGVSLQHFDGANAFQLLAGQGDELDINFGTEEAFSFTAKWLAQAFTTISTPSPSFSTEIFVPAWSGQSTLNGTTSAVINTGKLNIKRGTEAIFTQGQQSPHALFAGPCAVSGDMTFVVESGDTTLTTALATGTIPVILNLVDPNTGHFVHLQMSAVQLYDPKRTEGKIYTEVATSFVAEGNATDAVTGGEAQIVATVGNAQSAAY